MSNHIHMIIQSQEATLSDLIRDFKKFTAKFDKVGMACRNGCEVRDIRTAAGSDNIFVLKRKTSWSGVKLNLK